MDKQQLTNVFIGLRQRLRTVAATIIGEEDADDALQEAFCRLWMRSTKIPDDKSAAKLSVVTVRHVAIDEKRKSTTRKSLNTAEIAEKTDYGEQIERFEDIKALIFSRLDERQAQILWKRDYQDWDFNDIAAEYGISEANARRIVSRARKEIRNIYLQHKKRESDR